MVSRFEQEMRVGAMIRSMSGDVRDAFRKQVFELYDADENASSENCTYKESCARWHWLVLVYSHDISEIQDFIDFIQIAFNKRIDLDKDEKWKLLMRLKLPSQFIQKIETGFSQVPRLAIMDQTPLRKTPTGKRVRAIFRLE